MFYSHHIAYNLSFNLYSLQIVCEFDWELDDLRYTVALFFCYFIALSIVYGQPLVFRGFVETYILLSFYTGAWFAKPILVKSNYVLKKVKIAKQNKWKGIISLLTNHTLSLPLPFPQEKKWVDQPFFSPFLHLGPLLPSLSSSLSLLLAPSTSSLISVPSNKLLVAI